VEIERDRGQAGKIWSVFVRTRRHTEVERERERERERDLATRKPLLRLTPVWLVSTWLERRALTRKGISSTEIRPRVMGATEFSCASVLSEGVCVQLAHPVLTCCVALTAGTPCAVPTSHTCTAHNLYA